MTHLHETIMAIRKRTGCPYWVIETCLKLYGGDVSRTMARLSEMYSVMGDHPEVVIAREEEKLRKEIQND